MPEAGGSTTQSGILYQNSVTALYLGRLLDTSHRPDQERVAHIRVEAPTEVDDTIITFADSHRDYIQSKEHIRDNSSEWKKLWSDFDTQFRKKEFKRGQDRLLLYIGFGLEKHYELLGLCERAANSATTTEWQSRLSQAQQNLLAQIEPHLLSTGLTTEYSQELLAHVKVEILSQSAIERDRLRDWMPHTNRTPAELFRLLRDRIGGTARVKGNFEAYLLRKSLLAESPDLQFDIPTDISSLREKIQACGSLLRQHQHTISGTNIHIRQEATDKIVEWLLGDSVAEKNVSMLLDQAGMGKTVVMRDVLSELEQRNVDVLAIKADQQLSNIKFLTEVQNKLVLPYPVEQIVSRLAQLSRFVILIDQIDALSLSLAHDEQAINVTLDLIARLRLIPNVRILLSCRIFDYHSDPRLKMINVEQIFTLSKLSESQIQGVFNAIKVDYSQLTPATKDLLGLPLHLDLFARTVATDIELAQLYGISSLQELYALIWQHVIRRQEVGSPSVSERVEVINRLTEYMDRQQRIAVPQSVLDTQETRHLERAVNWLASAGILMRGKTEWTFLHQTFFDYCYARRFVEAQEDIVTIILASRQSIFERPKLIQIISYLRGYDHAHYIQDLQRLFNASGLRFHLHDLLLRWFGALPNPTDEEWLLAVSMLLDDSRFTQLLNTMYGNADWFPRLKPMLSNWLIDQSRSSSTITYLESLIDTTQAEVISLLEPFLGRNEEWNTKIASTLSRIRNWHTEEAVSLYEQTIYKLTELNRMDLWHLRDVCKLSPIAGCRITRHIFNLALTKYKEGRPASFLSSILLEEFQQVEDTIAEVLRTVSSQAPKDFLEQMLPWLEEVIILQVDYKDRDCFTADALSHDWHSNTFRNQSAFIHSLIDTLTQTAQREPETFKNIARRLASLPYETPQKLLTYIYRALPETYWEDAFIFLASDRRRLDIGDEQYDTRQVLNAIYPFLSEKQRVQLEGQIFDYAPIYKHLGLGALRWRGIEQYRLLSSIPSHLLSDSGQRRLREWQRKFPDILVSKTPRTRMVFGSVGPPIESELAAKMSDKHWLRAMDKYQKGIEHKEFLKGGAGELAQVLSGLIKNNPERFYSLFRKVPSSLDDAYVIAFANGFADSSAPKEWAFDVFRQYADRIGRNARSGLAHAIQRLAKHDVPEDVITKLIEWIYSAIGEDELWWSKGDNHGDAFHSYLNSARGAAFETLMRIFDTRGSEQAYEQKWRLIEFASSDSSAALRVGAIYELTYMIHYDRAKSWHLFEQLIAGHEILLETSYVREFLYWSIYKNFRGIQPYIEQMMQHSKPDVQQMGAGLACISAISEKALESDEALAIAQALAEKAITGQPAMRKGAAHIYAFNLARGSEKHIRSFCKEKIGRLIDDEDEGVRNEINHIFYSLGENDFLDLRDLINDIASAERHPLDHQFAEYLWKFGMLDPEWTLSVIQAVVSKPVLEPWGFGIEEIMRFILRAYTSHTIENSVREKAMDTFDTLMRQYAGVANKILFELDRR